MLARRERGIARIEAGGGWCEMGALNSYSQGFLWAAAGSSGLVLELEIRFEGLAKRRASSGAGWGKAFL